MYENNLLAKKYTAPWIFEFAYVAILRVFVSKYIYVSINLTTLLRGFYLVIDYINYSSL